MKNTLGIINIAVSIITAAFVLILSEKVSHVQTLLDEANPRPKKVQYGGHSYLFVPKQMIWEEAQANAVSQGGYLAVPNSEEENKFISDIVRKSNVYEAVWVGITDKEEEGVWKTVTNEPLVFQNWFKGEPNGRKSENYVNLGWSDPYTWNDVNSNGRHVFVIEFNK